MWEKNEKKRFAKSKLSFNFCVNTTTTPVLIPNPSSGPGALNFIPKQCLHLLGQQSLEESQRRRHASFITLKIKTAVNRTHTYADVAISRSVRTNQLRIWQTSTKWRTPVTSRRRFNIGKSWRKCNNNREIIPNARTRFDILLDCLEIFNRNYIKSWLLHSESVKNFIGPMWACRSGGGRCALERWPTLRNYAPYVVMTLDFRPYADVRRNAVFLNSGRFMSAW